MGVRVTGRVKFFSDKGFGFIAPDNGGDDVFVHKTGLVDSLDSLCVDQRVSFEIVSSERRNKGNGKKADKVMLL
jgi:CspA family cold shock protein